MQLRPYQLDLKNAVKSAWAGGARNVCAQLATGGGKTIIFSDLIREEGGPTVAIAHRQELVTQISLALARNSLRHRIIGPPPVVRLCVQIHMAELGKAFVDPSSQVAVAGVDTLVRREEALRPWAEKVSLWVQDEGHHVLESNKWGTAARMFPNARGLGVTATPERADGKGLGRHAEGLYDILVEGPPMRGLIDQGYLTDYRIFAPPSDLDLGAVPVSATTGDFNQPKMVDAVKRSRVVGDVVQHYLKLARGKLGVTFAVDVAEATRISDEFRKAGIPSEVVHAKTPALERSQILSRFRRRELLQLVNVDLFGEGFDLPAIEVVSMARPTESFVLFCQQFGRSLRLLEGKTSALIIDHVGNVIRHGLPDATRTWTLDRREGGRRGSSDGVPVKYCPACSGVYERVYSVCPYCGHKAVPALRNGPEHVDGDLAELDAETLAAMRADVQGVDAHPGELMDSLRNKGMPEIGVMSAGRRHVHQQEVQRGLRESIALWGGYRKAEGYSDSESQKLFWFKFGVDVLSAQALDSKKAEKLKSLVDAAVNKARSLPS